MSPRGRGLAARAWAPLLLGFAACLPNPQSIDERRESFPRAKLMFDVILEKTPPGSQPVGTVFEREIELLAYRLDPPKPKRGERVKIELYWQSKKPISQNWRVFVHGDAVGGEDVRRRNWDHEPAGGVYPTDVWQPGEVIVDRFYVRVPSQYAAPKIAFYIGLYRDKYRVKITSSGQVHTGSDNRARVFDFDFE